MRIYISGPMTGKPDLNEPLFRSTEERLRGMGHDGFQSLRSAENATQAGLSGLHEVRSGVDMRARRRDCRAARMVRLARLRRSKVATRRLPSDLPIYEAVAAGFFRKHVWVAIVAEPYGDGRVEAVPIEARSRTDRARDQHVRRRRNHVKRTSGDEKSRHAGAREGHGLTKREEAAIPASRQAAMLASNDGLVMKEGTNCPLGRHPYRRPLGRRAGEARA